MRQFETTNGSIALPGLHTDPPSLLGWPIYELSNMDGAIDAGAENYLLIYGDFSQFLLVDRFPSAIELIQNLFGVNNRPTGQRGLFLWARTGSDVLVDQAFRILNVT